MWQQIGVVNTSIWYKFFLSKKSQVITWLSRAALFCVSSHRQVSCTQSPLKVSAEKGCISWHWLVGWSDIIYVCDAVKVPVCYTDVLCLHLNCPQEGSQDYVASVRVIHHSCGLCMTPIKGGPQEPAVDLTNCPGVCMQSADRVFGLLI